MKRGSLGGCWESDRSTSQRHLKKRYISRFQLGDPVFRDYLAHICWVNLLLLLYTVFQTPQWNIHLRLVQGSWAVTIWDKSVGELRSRHDSSQSIARSSWSKHFCRSPSDRASRARMYMIYAPNIGWMSTAICFARVILCFLRTSTSWDVMNACRYAESRNCQYLSRRDSCAKGSWSDGMESPSTNLPIFDLASKSKKEDIPVRKIYWPVKFGLWDERMEAVLSKVVQKDRLHRVISFEGVDGLRKWLMTEPMERSSLNAKWGFRGRTNQQRKLSFLRSER